MWYLIILDHIKMALDCVSNAVLMGCDCRKNTAHTNLAFRSRILYGLIWKTMFLVTSVVICQLLLWVVQWRVKIIGESLYQWPKTCHTKQTIYWFISYMLLLVLTHSEIYKKKLTLVNLCTIVVYNGSANCGIVTSHKHLLWCQFHQLSSGHF